MTRLADYLFYLVLSFLAFLNLPSFKKMEFNDKSHLLKSFDCTSLKHSTNSTQSYSIQFNLVIFLCTIQPRSAFNHFIGLTLTRQVLLGHLKIGNFGEKAHLSARCP